MSTIRSFTLFAASVLFICGGLRAQSLTIEGAPTDSGFNIGTPAGIRATLKGIGSEPARFAVFAEIQYIGTCSKSSGL